ncbi:MAG: peptidylprolyl isomerase [Bacteriovoracaceae bacterium]|jgi:peptidyl-prolyl cis-trans isomerase C|nr:peptidylprolyl isomerase [Bacteriovoracaceae bacterium]
MLQTKREDYIKYYRAKHILLTDQDDLEYIIEKLKEGSSFEALAKEFSECDSGKKGGNLGKFPSGSMLPEFERALSKMSIGEIKYGVKTKFGIHIILREE